MTSRERMLTALQHQEADRVPIDLGGGTTGIEVEAYDRLKPLLGFQGQSRTFVRDHVEIDEQILQRFGADILNPVQVAATGMDPKELKAEFGKDLTFWGGGCDTQKVLTFGTPDEVEAEVRRRISELAPGGGFVFNQIHNVQPQVPAENIVRMLDTALEYGRYPLRA